MLVPRMRPFASTIFAEMSALALRTGAINLGQGLPDTDGPPSLLADAAANIAGGVNQYPPGTGVPALREAVTAHQKRFTATVYPPAGTYFVVTDVTPLGFDDGAQLCWSLPERVGVAAVPVSGLCADPDLGRTLVRFAFCKRDEVLTEAVARLGALRPR